MNEETTERITKGVPLALPVAFDGDYCTNSKLDIDSTEIDEIGLTTRGPNRGFVKALQPRPPVALQLRIPGGNQKKNKKTFDGVRRAAPCWRLGGDLMVTQLTFPEIGSDTVLKGSLSISQRKRNCAADAVIESAAGSRSNSSPQAIEEPAPLLTAEQMRKELAVGVTTFQNMKKRGMPCIKLAPNTYRFDRAKVMAWVETESRTQYSDRPQ